MHVPSGKPPPVLLLMKLLIALFCFQCILLQWNLDPIQWVDPTAGDTSREDNLGERKNNTIEIPIHTAPNSIVPETEHQSTEYTLQTFEPCTISPSHGSTASVSPTPLPSPPTVDTPLPRLWIYVEEFSEGMATWRISFAEILLVAKRLGAVVVEPCIGEGRLRTCRDARYRLSQVYDMEKLRQFHPYIVSYQDYRAAMVEASSKQQQQQQQQQHQPKVFSMCLQMPQGLPSPLMVCGFNTTNMYQVTTNHILQQALDECNNRTLAETSTTTTASSSSPSSSIVVLHLKYYRMGGFRKTKIGRNRLVRPIFLNDVLSKYFDFERYHYHAVDRFLHQMGIDTKTNNFDVIHWRAELPNLNHKECAKKIMIARDVIQSMEDLTRNSTVQSKTPTILMSSIHRQHSLQWSSAPYRQQQAMESLNQLSAAGIFKLDDVLFRHQEGQQQQQPQQHLQDLSIQDPIMDKVVIAIWDQILANRARRFATCTKNCRTRYPLQRINASCVPCNYLGNFAMMSVELRRTHGKSSEECWPLLSG